MANNETEQIFIEGLRYLEAKQLDKAEQFISRVVSLDPNRAINHYFLAACLFEQGRFGDAEKAARNAVRLDAKDPENIMFLGRTLLRQDKLDEAEKCFKQGSMMDPHNQQYYSEWQLVTQCEPFMSRLAAQRGAKA